MVGIIFILEARQTGILVAGRVRASLLGARRSFSQFIQNEDWPVKDSREEMQILLTASVRSSPERINYLCSRTVLMFGQGLLVNDEQSFLSFF